ncbi:MAG: hypothetical protein JSW71_04480, partial [Gemmatimonadota bacterium]
MRRAFLVALSSAVTSVLLIPPVFGQRVGVATRDSGGVTIVENVEPAWSEAERWRFGPEPVLDIGELEGDPEYELHRVVGAVRLPDGRIVIANSGTYQLRFFESDGAYIRNCGRRGGGPGEFEGLWGVSRFRTDSLATFDWRQNRISVFDDEGSFVRAITLRSADALAEAIGSFSDGSFLSRTRSSAMDRETGSLRRDWILHRLDAEGRIVDTLGSFRGDEVFVNPMAGDLIIAATRFFARSSEFAVLGDQFYVADTENFEVRVYDTVGELRSIICKKHDNLEVTRSDIDHLRSQ